MLNKIRGWFDPLVFLMGGMAVIILAALFVDRITKKSHRWSYEEGFYAGVRTGAPGQAEKRMGYTVEICKRYATQSQVCLAYRGHSNSSEELRLILISSEDKPVMEPGQKFEVFSDGGWSSLQVFEK